MHRNWRAWPSSWFPPGRTRRLKACRRPFAARSYVDFLSVYPLPKSANESVTDVRFADSFPTPCARRSVTPGFIFSALLRNLFAMDAKKLAVLCRNLADNKKAEDILVLDVRKISTVTDYFVLASGTSEPHLRAIADEITDGLQREAGVRPR